LPVLTYENKQHIKGAFLYAFTHTLPMLPSLTVLGMTYGILMQANGYGVLWSTLMSAIAFCGSMQFAAIPLMTTGFVPIQAFILSFLVNARHIFYGIPMLNKFKGTGNVRLFNIFALSDESFSLFCSLETPEKTERKYIYFWITFFIYIYWVVGTTLGAVVGSFINGNLEGLNFAMPALFLVMFLEQWEKAENRPMALIGFGCSIASLLILGSANYMIPAMILMAILLLGGRKRGWF
jgi:4-azaleucine resistance transporter AzlC